MSRLCHKKKLSESECECRDVRTIGVTMKKKHNTLQKSEYELPTTTRPSQVAGEGRKSRPGPSTASKHVVRYLQVHLRPGKMEQDTNYRDRTGRLLGGDIWSTWPVGDWVRAPRPFSAAQFATCAFLLLSYCIFACLLVFDLASPKRPSRAAPFPAGSNTSLLRKIVEKIPEWRAPYNYQGTELGPVSEKRPSVI